MKEGDLSQVDALINDIKQTMQKPVAGSTQ